MIGDTHCHLSLLSSAEAAVEEALQSGVSPILAVSMDADEAEAVIGLRERYGGQVLAGVGLHPSRVVELDEAAVRHQLDRIGGLAAGADFVGEIGLDYKDATTDRHRELQREAFASMLALAEARRLPVNLHSRRADRHVMDAAIAFRRRSGLGAVMHWFTHSAKLARICAGEGVFISVGPSVLLDPPGDAGEVSTPTRQVASSIDSTILLVETDSPVVYGRLGAARPSWARDVARELSSLRVTGRDELESTLAANLRRYLERDAA